MPVDVNELPGPEDNDEAAEDALLDSLKTGAWLDRQVFPPLAWAVHGLLPEGFGLFTGAPKAGKSWAALGIALSVSSGTPALGSVDTGEARPVLLLALEDGDRRLQGRCRALLGDGTAIPELMDYQTSTSPQLVLPLIRAWLRKHGHQRPLIVLDTLGKVMPPALPGEGAYQRDYRIGSQLKRLVDEHPGSCLLVVHHTRKAGAEDWMDSTSGTNGLNGAADWTANLSRPRNEDRGVLRVTGRDVPEGEYAIKSEAGRWTIEGDALADAAKVAAEAKMTADLGDRSAEILNYVTKLGEVTAKQVCDALDLPDARRYLARLHDAGKLAKPKRGTYTPVPSVPMSQLDEGDWDKGTDGTPVQGGPDDRGASTQTGGPDRTGGHDDTPTLNLTGGHDEPTPTPSDQGIRSDQGPPRGTGASKTSPATNSHAEVDDRPRCETCDKALMGKTELTAGTCTWCQRIHIANEKARKSA